MADNRDSGARRALPGEGSGMSGVVGLAEQLAVAVKALEEIRKRSGAVCAQYEVCEHPACQASYAAWALADEALATLREDKRA